MSQSTQTSIKLPKLDISKTQNSTSLSCLLEACKEWGFFHIINHGLSQELCNKLCVYSKEIFNLPLDTKLNIGPSSKIRNYTPQFIASPYYEGLKVNGPDLFSSAQSSANLLFGQQNNTSQFSGIVQEYGDKMTSLCNQLVKTILMSLGDNYETKLYEKEFNKCYGYLRIIQYSTPSPTPAPPPQEEEVEGLGKHTDMCCMTILYSDDSSCLQVKSKDGKWLSIEPCEGSLVVNLGDMLEAWSNGKLRSSEHRVVLKNRRNRMCLAFFWSFEDDKVIFAPNEIVGDGNSRVFKPFVCKDYVRFREFDDKERYEKVGHTVRDFAGVM